MTKHLVEELYKSGSDREKVGLIISRLEAELNRQRNDYKILTAIRNWLKIYLVERGKDV